MKVATFNANSLRSRLDIILGWLDRNAPDVLCVQETKVQDQDFPAEAFARTGYEFVFKGQKKYNGVAIFSKGHIIEEVAFGLDSEPQDAARLIRATINGVSFVNSYIPQGHERDCEKFEYKLQWLHRLGEYFAKHFDPEDKLVWTGDLNVALDQRDVYDPQGLWGHVCYCREVQEALGRVMQWGFTDVFRLHCQEEGNYTFWDYRANSFRRNLGWRLDYIMATAPLAQKCTQCRIDKEPRTAERPSDHTFLVAEFDI